MLDSRVLLVGTKDGEGTEEREWREGRWERRLLFFFFLTLSFRQCDEYECDELSSSSHFYFAFQFLYPLSSY